MKKEFAALVSAFSLLAAANVALAGAYGDKAQPEESPAAAPAPPTEAEDAPEGYWYIGAGALYSIENFNCEADNAWGYNIRAGRRINPMFAVEAEWEHPASQFDDSTRVDGFGQPGKDVTAWEITANGKFYPIRGSVQPYALVGGGYYQADLPHDQNGGFVARFGLGVDYLITDNIGVDAEVGYLLGTGDVSNFDQVPISVGAFYNFR